MAQKIKRNRIIALVLATVLAVSALAVGLSNTLAAKPGVPVLIEQPNSYPVINKGGTYLELGLGMFDLESSDPSTGTAVITNNGTRLTTTGHKAGVVTISVGSKGGLAAGVTYQIKDTALISQCEVKNGAELPMKKNDTKYATDQLELTPSNAAGTIKWKSLQTEVATVNRDTGLITAKAKGAAILIGEFIDCWGVQRDLHILVLVDMRNASLGDLLDWIMKGETILGLNPNPYTPESLADLQDAVNNGKGVANSADPSEQEIQDAIQDIKDAIDNLELKEPENPNGWIKKPGGGWYRPVGWPKNVYEVMNEDKSSKEPPEYIWDDDSDGDGNPATGDNNHPAEKENEITYWVEDPENIWHKVKGDGTLSDDDGDVVWGGPNGKPGGGDDLPVKKFGNDWWVNRGQNVWQKVNPNGNNAKQLGPLTGGGPDDNPATDPVTPIFPSNNNGLPFNDGKYYIGPIDPGPNEYYIGDKPSGQGGDGKLNSSLDYLDDTDCIYWLVDGKMVTTPPVGPDEPDAADGDRVLGTDKTGDSSEWIEIARSGGYSLIIRRNYINTYEGGGTSHVGQPDWQYANYGTSDTYKTPTSSGVRNAINKWFKGTATNNADKLPLDARLRNYTMSNNASDLPGTANEAASLTNGFSKPNTYQDGMNDDIAFALSASEAIKFCSKMYRINSNFANNSVAPAPAKFNKLVIPANGTYNGSYYSFGVWLRSAGTLKDGQKTGGIINGSDGDVFQFHLNHGTPSGNTESGLVYPALWVKSTIFTDPVVNIPGNGGTYTDDKGITWIVLTTDGNGNKLLMTDYVYMEVPDGPKYVNSGNYVAYESSNLKTAMENWFNNNAGSDIKGIARGYATPLPSGNSTAGGTVGTGKPFPLSADEFNNLVPAGKKKGVGFPSGYSGRDWYLRTSSATTSVNMVNSAGNVASCSLGLNTTGIRPAIWVKP